MLTCRPTSKPECCGEGHNPYSTERFDGYRFCWIIATTPLGKIVDFQWGMLAEIAAPIFVPILVYFHSITQIENTSFTTFDRFPQLCVHY